MDHETDSEQIDGSTGGDEVFIMAGIFDEEGYNDRRDGGGEGEGLRDMAGGCERV